MKIKKSKKIISLIVILCFIIITIFQTTNLATSPTPSESPPIPEIQEPGLKDTWQKLGALDELCYSAYEAATERSNSYFDKNPNNEILNIGKVLTFYDKYGTITLDKNRYPNTGNYSISYPYKPKEKQNQWHPGAWNRTYFPGVFCASPKNHGGPRWTTPTQVIDITFDEVTISGTSSKHMSMEELSVTMADDLRLAAYCAYRSRQANEDYGVAMNTNDRIYL